MTLYLLLCQIFVIFAKYKKPIKMTVNIENNEFIAHFSKKPFFTIDELRSFYQLSEPEININTLRWRVYKLKNDGLISKISQGVYALQSHQIWAPVINSTIKSIYKRIEKHFNKLNFMIWHTAWINEFSNLQAFRYMIVIEVEKEFTQSVFEYLKETGLKNVYFNPDKKEIDYYLNDVSETYVVKAMISKSPSLLIENIKILKLEKLLVDLFCEKELLHSFQGSEVKNIFSKAFNTYSINNSVLLNYAQRRSRRKEIHDFILNNSDIKTTLL